MHEKTLSIEHLLTEYRSTHEESVHKFPITSIADGSFIVGETETGQSEGRPITSLLRIVHNRLAEQVTFRQTTDVQSLLGFKLVEQLRSQSIVEDLSRTGRSRLERERWQSAHGV